VVRRKQEQVANTASHRAARKDPVRRKQEQEADKASHRTVRKDSVRRKQEQEANTASHRAARKDPVRRKQEQEADKVSHRTVRKDPVHRSQERQKDRAAKSNASEYSKSSYEKLFDKYSQTIQLSPSLICSSSGGLWYAKSTIITSKEMLTQRGCREDYYSSKRESRTASTLLYIQKISFSTPSPETLLV
jgi:hypothetical protein